MNELLNLTYEKQISILNCCFLHRRTFSISPLYRGKVIAHIQEKFWDYNQKNIPHFQNPN